ncbi:acid phosphatase [Terricaulis silvestris]|uniref:Acid phosphatase n=1 Tax=Terricaulis silvestris TaxID=2686094 RepID=A0A6I6MVM9_9CAUL|nr:phosphatase PAP2 family protein [Terricaulis silvestris]QGZ96474.1 Major phosphate-irrepressible acid phosphatase precursor [Terricaulis silvestris]
MLRTLTIAVAFALAACATPAPAPVAAPTPSTEPTHPATPERNPAVQIDPSVFIPPPPVADGPLELAERAIVHGPWTAERRQQAVEDNQIDPFAAFDSVLGANFTGANFPATAAVLDRAGRAAGFAGDPIKFVHRRDRPFVHDDSIVTCIPRPTSYSYPSGHAALGFGWSLVLAELVPSRADAIINRGRDFTWSRVVCGVHYPSDVEAGRTVASAAIARLHADPDFQRELTAARAELAAAGLD